MFIQSNVIEVRMVMSDNTGGQSRGERIDSSMPQGHKDDDGVIRRDFAPRGSDAHQDEGRQDRMDSINEEGEVSAAAPQEESRQERMDSSADEEALQPAPAAQEEIPAEPNQDTHDNTTEPLPATSASRNDSTSVSTADQPQQPPETYIGRNLMDIDFHQKVRELVDRPPAPRARDQRMRSQPLHRLSVDDTEIASTKRISDAESHVDEEIEAAADEDTECLDRAGAARDAQEALRRYRADWRSAFATELAPDAREHVNAPDRATIDDTNLPSDVRGRQGSELSPLAQEQPPDWPWVPTNTHYYYTHNFDTRNTYTHNGYTHNYYTHNFCTHNFYTQNFYGPPDNAQSYVNSHGQPTTPTARQHQLPAQQPHAWQQTHQQDTTRLPDHLASTPRVPYTTVNNERQYSFTPRAASPAPTTPGSSIPEASFEETCSPMRRSERRPDVDQSSSSGARRPQAEADALEVSRSPLPAPRPRNAGFLVGPDSSPSTSPAITDDDYEEQAEAALRNEMLRRETERMALLQLGRMNLPSESPSPARQPGGDGPVIVDGRTPEQREQNPLSLARLERRESLAGATGSSN